MDSLLQEDVLHALCTSWARIEDLEHWTSNSNARNEYGYGVHATSPSAVKWCAVGALLEAYYEVGNDPIRLLEEAAHLLYAGDIVLVNDTLGHYAVSRCYALAVALHEEAHHA